MSFLQNIVNSKEKKRHSKGIKVSENYSLEELILNDSFIRWITNKGNIEDDNYWNEWIVANSHNRELYEEVKNIIEFIHDEYSIPNREYELMLLKRNINLYKNTYRNGKGNYKKYKKIFFYISIAASIAIIFVYGQGIFPIKRSGDNYVNHNFKMYKTSYGQNKIIKLYDGSKIALNSNTKLKIKSYRVKDKIRLIKIRLNGEAFFSIKHHYGLNKRVIQIVAHGVKIVDLGTRFDVNSYSNNTKTILISGRLYLNYKNGKKYGYKKYILRPGYASYYDALNNKIKQKKVNTYIYTSWMNGIWYFHKTPLSDVAKRIHDIYGCKVIITERSMKNYKISGSINSKNINVIKEALQRIIGRKIVQKGNVIWIK